MDDTANVQTTLDTAAGMLRDLILRAGHEDATVAELWNITHKVEDAAAELRHG